MQNDQSKEDEGKAVSSDETSTQDNEVTLSLLGEIIGKDEMNLIEHPFAVLQREHAKGAVIEIEWEHTHPKTNKRLSALWRATGDEELGLPGPTEERLYLALMQLTKESASQVVSFSRGDLLTRMGMTLNQKNYEALRDAFTRLKAISIRADNCFWDARSKNYFASKGFSLIDNFEIIDEPKGRKSDSYLPLSSFKWNDVIYRSLQSGHLRSLDLGYALSLKLPLSMRLFRYLDKHRKRGGYYQRTYEIEIDRLCRVRLGMTASDFPSKYKERLKGAHQELLTRGYLGKIEYSSMSRGKGIKVVYTYACRDFNKQALAYAASQRFAVLPEEEKERLLKEAVEVVGEDFKEFADDPSSLLSDTLWQLMEE